MGKEISKMKNVEIIKAKALETGAITPEEVEKYESDDLTIPVKSFIGWKSEDYHINRGEKAAFKAEVWVKAGVKVQNSLDAMDAISSCTAKKAAKAFTR